MYFYNIKPETESLYIKSCSVCGATASEVSKSGFVGCSECYKTFAALLDPYITKIHGKAVHRGRMPSSCKKEG